MYEDGAPALSRDDEGDADEVGREVRPGSVVDLRNLPTDVHVDLERLLGRNAQRAALQLAEDSESLEHEANARQVIWFDVADRQLAARDRGQADEGADLDMVGADVRVGAPESLDPLDLQNSSADTGDASTHGVQQMAKILDVRLRCRVAQHGRPVGEHRRHDRVLGAGDARLIEEDLGAPQFPAQHELVTQLDFGTQLLQRIEMRIEAATTDHVATRWWEAKLLGAREQRSSQQDGGADPRGELGLKGH